MKITDESTGREGLRVYAIFVTVFWWFSCLISFLPGCFFLFLLLRAIALGLPVNPPPLYGLNDTLRYCSGAVGAPLFFFLGALANAWLWHDDEVRGRLDQWADKFSALPHQIAATLILFVCAPIYLAELARVLLRIPRGLAANKGLFTRLVPKFLSSVLGWVALLCGCLSLTTNLYAYVYYPLVTFDPRPGAKVSVDGVELGETPVTQPLTVGRHHLKLVLFNQSALEEELQVPMGGLVYYKILRVR